MLMVLVLVLVPSGGGRGFAYRAELPESSGEEVRRGVEKAVGTGKEWGAEAGEGRAGWSWADVCGTGVRGGPTRCGGI
jgi:hypothetical protein